MKRLDSVGASLALSYGLLDENRQRFWRQLAVFPDAFDTPAAAAVWELEIDPAWKALGDLALSGLVEWEEKEERYRLHDLARSFADRQLEKTEREAAQSRHAEYFLELLRTADDLYREGGGSLDLGLRMFDAEWSNIQAGFGWASARFPGDKTAARICDEYPNAGRFLLALRQHPRERIRWRELAIAAARQRNDRRSEGRHLGNLGLAYADLGEPRRAIEYHEQALAIARETGDRHTEGTALGSLGNAYSALGELRRAIELYEQRLAIAREISDRRGEGAVLGNLGLAYAILREPQRAIEYHEQALAIDRDIGDRQGEGQDLGNLGLAYATLGEPRRAIEHYEQWLAIAREIGDRRGEGAALGNLGLAYAALGDPRRAIELYEQVLAIAREIGDRVGEAKTSWNLGLVIEKEGDLTRAADLMQVRVDYWREIGHPDAEKHAAYVAALRARIAEQGS